jgi:hypothetical protein
VNHQVENYVDIERTGGEDGKPVSLKEHGAAEFGLDGEHGRVEALKVSGLQDAAAFGGASDEVVGLGEGGDQGLFDEQVEARVEEGRGYRMMVDGGNGDGGRVQAEIGAKEFIDRCEDGDGEFGGGFGGADGIRLDGGDQGYT